MPGAIYKTPEKHEEKPKSRPSAVSRLAAVAVADAKPAPEPERKPRKTEENRLSMPKPDREDGGRSWQIRLTPSLVTMLSIVMVVTLCFFFLFGVIVGRGYAPVTPVAEPERFLPDEPASLTAEAPERVLPPEDLRFMSNLRDQTSPAPLPTQQQPAVTQPGATAQGAAPAAARPNPAVTQPGNVTQPPAPAAATPDAEISDYVLQAAAFKVESQADNLRETLEGLGVRTKLVREKADKGTWYKVQVLFRGTPQTLEELRQTMSGKGIKDSLVISKKPVS